MKGAKAASLDRKAYHIAKDFLLTLDERVNPQVVSVHIAAPKRIETLPEVYATLLMSAQSPNMKPSVISDAIGGFCKLGPLLCDFDPKVVCEKYGERWERVLDDVVQQLSPRGQIRREPRSIWPRFCKTIISGASFLSQFRDGQDFHRQMGLFDDPRLRVALPMLLAQEIEGIGFALACDFLKELGYTGYIKPDIHIKTIFVALGLSDSDEDYAVFKAGIRLAENAGVTPYAVDKIFWTIGSGKFPKSDFKAKGQREEFIRHARETLFAR